MIPMVDLKAQYHTLKAELDTELLRALENTQFILGPNVQAFEQEVSAYLGVKDAVGCASGTDALHLALAAAGIGEGDEVITTPFTFIATAEAIRYLGATPVFVDIDPKTFNIDVDQVKAVLGERTKAVIPVHLFGQPADVVGLLTLCKEFGIALVEDCAQSFGAAVGGQMTGSFGLAGCFSFFPSKNLGCFGDGGMVTTNSEELAESLRMLRNHGSKVRYHHDVIGYNSRLDELQAVILRVKLKHIDDYNRERQVAAHRYNELLADTDVVTPHEDGSGVHVFHQYTLLCDRRDAVIDALKARGIASAIYYPIPLHRQRVFAEAYQHVRLPVAEDVAHRCLSLPIYPELPEEAIVRITAVIRETLV
jgi:dTDP-4-amino-4,6-dideoxygalactose transaminase